MNQIVQTAVKAIIQKEGKFLIIKQNFPSGIYWDLPGGRVHHGESPYDALIREVKEETTLDVKIERPLGIFWFFRNDGVQIAATTFICLPQNSQVNLNQNPDEVEDIVEFRWITKDEFLNGDYPVTHESLKELIKKL
ncbi:MAG: NUDIX hydrolase [Patescibacteria group bacterium]